MSYVDLIIKYLSGDLKQDEATSFEQELATNSELKREFEEVSVAYNLIRDQLQKRDEESFRKKLEDAMNHEEPSAEPRSQWFRLHWFIPLAAACSLAILYIFTLHKPGDERVLSRFYDPLSDPVVLAYNMNTRGVPEPGVIQYWEGDYRRSMEELSTRILEEKENKLLQLYYLLSAIELDRQDEALATLEFQVHDSMQLPDQALAWYTTLALFKSDRRQEALELLYTLSKQQGPYQSEAIKLEKVLLK